MSDTDLLVHTSVEWLPVGTVVLKKNGVRVDPTSGTIEVAFVGVGADPASGDWKDADWDTDASGSVPVYTPICLVGSTVTLAIGEYARFWRLTLDDEVAVKRVPGILSVI